jgi:HSP20 family protein
MRVRFFYTPLRSVGEMQRDMERALQSWWDWRPANQRAPRGIWIPPTDVYETANDLIVKIDMAGTTEEQVEITLYPDMLVVAGSRQDRKVPPPTVIHQMDIWYGEYQAQVPLTVPIDPDKVEANYVNGIISVTLPKVKQEQTGPRKVPVGTPKSEGRTE